MKGWLIVILLLGLLFRIYNYDKGFSFAHDQDLYSWIAKDILVNHHNRLVGQITSVDGVFIGSAYYYLMAVFYKMGGMSPMAAVVPVTIIGLITIWSFYFVIKRHFGLKAGLWAAFIYSVSFGVAMFDRWSVPTQPTIIWSIWFLFVILETRKGNINVLPIYAFLCGFVWQLHIALLPILPLPIIGFVIFGNKFGDVFSQKYILKTIFSIFIFVVVMSPFFIFEKKHNYSQIKAMIVGINVDKGGPTGVAKFYKVVETSGREFQQRLLFDFDQSGVYQYWIGLIVLIILLVVNKKLELKLVFMLSLWIGMIFLAQFKSKRIVSEYYFTNLLPIYILVLAVFLAQIKYKVVSILIAMLYLIINLKWLATKSDDYESFFYKMEVVNNIKSDLLKNNYPCIALNFIADPGVGVGFRYLFWWQNVKLVRPGITGVPIYNIPIPWQISQKDNPQIFGRYGVIVPSRPVKIADQKVCDDLKNQLDPLLGYVE